MEDPSPPWFVTGPDGSLRPSAVPDRLLRHPELQERGIVPFDPLKPGIVFRTSPLEQPVYVVKVLDRHLEELAIYERLLRESSRPGNHTIPSVITSQGHPVLIMPMLGDVQSVHMGQWTPLVFIDVIYQLVEGIEFLHSLRIVHMDISTTNVMATLYDHNPAMNDDTIHGQLLKNRIYIIDFDSSRQFTLGPGVQRAITLPSTQERPPNGLKHFDPYSWDVYCVGRTLECLVEWKYKRRGMRPHPLAERYIRWLIGKERGCTGVCHCRPTARAALRVLVFLRWAVYASEGYHWVVDALSRLMSTSTRA